jgi:hypothetical protein
MYPLTQALPDVQTDPAARRPQSLPMCVTQRIGLGVYIVSLLGVILYFLVKLWPVTDRKFESSNFPWGTFILALDIRTMLIVALAGALGAYVHLATSFADYAGNDRLMRSWTWWYVLRPCVGAALAEIFYMTLRGGLVTGTEAVSLHGVAALASLTGLFSRQGTDKLRELFEHAFRTEKTTERKNGLGGGE